ncbi:MAG: hypothetical protein M2R45_00798 [Verrucomicrobia subdivision 3 bacterium]|nr:hypothetical protein [Limisphaerales bacterium]MCS1413097.1 hypothetical protein [Limisphaerales bacterium]
MHAPSKQRSKTFASLTHLAATSLGLGLIVVEPRSEGLNWKNIGEHRVARLDVDATGKTGFESLGSETTGITFRNQLTDQQVAENRIRENGSGVALGDINADGRTDIYFCCLDGPNVLYRNDGDWAFTDITAGSGVACPNQYSTGAAFADFDGDGDLDLTVTSIGGGVRVYHNNGEGRFRLDTVSTLIPQYGATSIAIADINNDGDLDLYVTNYRTSTVRDGQDDVTAEIKRINGEIVVTPENRFEGRTAPGGSVTIIERGEPDILYINRGKGVFIPVPWNSGAFIDIRQQKLSQAPRNWGLSALFHDLNDDQHPELYVCNDFFFSLDQAYFSRGGKQFQQYSPYSLRNMSLSAMAVDAADIDRDGDQDLFVVDMLSRNPAYRKRQRANAARLREMPPPIANPEFAPEVLRNTLFLNRGDNTFAEVAHYAGLEATEWSWGVAFMDVDLDGWEDCLITNGNYRDALDADALQRVRETEESRSLNEGLKNLQRFPRLETANLAFRNLGNLQFTETGGEWGFDTVAVSHGIALGDLDNDGDLDVVVNHLNQPAGIYQNTTPAPRIAIRLKGADQNTHAIGAKLELSGNTLPQTLSMTAGGRYLSSDAPIQTFAATGSETTLTVTWRNNTQTIIRNPLSNHIYEIHETAAVRPPSPDTKPSTNPLFRLTRSTIRGRHRDEPFNDLERQPLLARQYNRLGPGIAWFDLNDDGWEDLIVGSGRGGRLAVYHNEAGKRFVERTTPPITTPIARDLTSVLGWHRGNGDPVILAGSSHYEDGVATGAATFEYDLTLKRRLDSIPIDASSAGPLALADIDRDGDLDLFIGGRIISGKFPQPADSRIFRHESGQWIADEMNQIVLEKLGLVSAATFSDLNQDGFPDLILALEWGSIKVFLNRQGTFTDATVTMGLSPHTGWWNGVATGDFNGDGKIDLVASNWGQNTKYQSFREKPLQLYYGDFSRNGGIIGIESFFDESSGRNHPWADLDTLATVLPEVRRRFPTYRAYSEASTEAVIAPYRAQALQLRAATLESMIFLNQGGHFSAQPLPPEAQLAPAFGIGVADFDGDGYQDIALAQNFFDVEPTTSRYDAGRGLLLTGDGSGQFQALTAKESGIRLYGEQRSLALADYNHDGRTDLVITENHGPIRLYTNTQAQPALRVKLLGAAPNPRAIGAQLRLGDNQALGPLYEIKSGTGYWSQDSDQIVLSGPARQKLWVRWPDGKESTFNIPDDAGFATFKQAFGASEGE